MSRVRLFTIALLAIGLQGAQSLAYAAPPPDDRATAAPSEVAVTPQQQQELMKLRTAAPSISCPGAFPTAVGFSASGSSHKVSGMDVQIGQYAAPAIELPVGAFSPTTGTFVAPCNGLYYFSYSFEKDAYQAPCTGGNAAGEDDVSVYLVKTAGTSSQALGFSAWSGEGDGRRGTGANSRLVRLARGDMITSWSHEDGNEFRCLAAYSLTGYRVAP